MGEEVMEGVNDPVSNKDRFEELNQLEMKAQDKERYGTNYYLYMEYIANLVKNAYIAGVDGTKGLGLNYSKEERATEYCKMKGLIP